MRTQSLMRIRHLCDLCTCSDIIVLIVHAYIRMYFYYLYVHNGVYTYTTKCC